MSNTNTNSSEDFVITSTQEQINYLYYVAATVTATETTDAIRAVATARHAQYPQYEGHWDGPEWQLYIARKRIKTKAGLHVLPGDVVIGRQHTCEWGTGNFVFYSLRVNIEVRFESASKAKMVRA